MILKPAIYEHAAKLIGYSPWIVSQDKELMCKAHIQAHNIYQHDPIVVAIDIYNVEAEACGAEIEQGDGVTLPAIRKYIYTDVNSIPQSQLYHPESDGRLVMIISAGKEIKKILPNTTVMIPVSGPFSILSQLVGFETLILNAFLQPGQTQRVLNNIVQSQLEYCQLIVDAGLEITVFESAVSPPLLSPDLFRNVVFGPLCSLLQNAARITGHPLPCIIGGNTIDLLDDIIKTGTSFIICPTETDQQAFMQKMLQYPHVGIRINTPPHLYCRNDFDKVKESINHLLSIAQNHRNVCLGTSALPYEAITDIVLKAMHYTKTKEI